MPVKLELACTIGSNVTIGDSQTSIPIIGDGAVIGANAVVRCDVAPFHVVAGIPVKIVNKITANSFYKYSLRLSALWI